MHVAVVGAGVVGSLTAHFLNQKNCQVTVYDSACGTATRTSFANGGQLSYSFCDPLADPLLLRKLPGIVLGADLALTIANFWHPKTLRWGLSFLRQCSATRRDANARSLIALALQSEQLMSPLVERYSNQCAHSHAGKLVLLDQMPDRETRRRVALKQNSGLQIELIDRATAQQIEPTLADWQWQPNAAIFSRHDQAADTHTFCQQLTRDLIQRGINQCLQTTVRELHCETHNRVRVITALDEQVFDAVVIATGDDASSILQRLGIRLPIMAMAGYSWTFPALASSPRVSLTALHRRMVFTRLNQEVRIAGFADVGCKDNQRRADQLKLMARELAPVAADYLEPQSRPWQGFRAVTPNSLPIVGATKMPGVYTNLGHGMLGWTLAAATGKQIAEQVCT